MLWLQQLKELTPKQSPMMPSPPSWILYQKTATQTPKRLKIKFVVSPISAPKQSNTTRHPNPEAFSKTATAPHLTHSLTNSPTAVTTNLTKKFPPTANPLPLYGKPVAVVYSNNINQNPGVMTLLIAKTYKKMKWDSNCDVISICNPGCNTKAIRCFESVANFLKKKLPTKMIKNISNILDPDNFNLNKILTRLGEHNITFTQTNQTFEDICSCQTTTGDTILIVLTNGLHKHKIDNPDNPDKGIYVICRILIPQSPYVLLTFSSTNQNCWLKKNASNRTEVLKTISQKNSWCT